MIDLKSVPSLSAVEAELDRRSKNKISSLFPDKGKFRRELYPKQIEFFSAGAESRERCFLAANRVGKTVAGAYEIVCHATGVYPPWWTGRKISEHQLYWCCGDTAKTVRDILQLELLGPHGKYGTGLIPCGLILRYTTKQGISDAVEFVYVKHKDGGESTIVFKSYDQRREAFQGGKPIGIWLDEECPMDIYVECLTRTMTNNGLLWTTFTPLMGVTDVVKSYMPDYE